MSNQVTFQLKGMKKPQQFILYPLAEGEKEIYIQSDTRMVMINLETGEGMMSRARTNAGFAHVHPRFGAFQIELTPDQLTELKLQVVANGEIIDVGDAGCVFADNSGISVIKF